LEEGVGYGRVSISLLYKVRSPSHLLPSSPRASLLSLYLPRAYWILLLTLFSSSIYQPIEVDLPPNLLGWETGTVCLGSQPIQIQAAPGHADLIESFKTLVVSTSDTTEKLGKKRAKVKGEMATFDIESLRVSLRLSSFLRPVQARIAYVLPPSLSPLAACLRPISIGFNVRAVWYAHIFPILSFLDGNAHNSNSP
jgi:hypothetical protein